MKLIKRYISEGISFNQETTLSGRSIINNIKIARKNGSLIWEYEKIPVWAYNILKK